MLPLTEFYRRGNSHMSKCKSCRRDMVSDWRSRNPEKEAAANEARRALRSEEYLEQQRVAAKARTRAVKAEVIEHYGGKCACCGVVDLVFLAIDHVNGGGNAHRKEVGAGYRMYRWLKVNGYPDGYRVLCHNCNFAEHNGGCPHRNA
jgi:hypothetical protein